MPVAASGCKWVDLAGLGEPRVSVIRDNAEETCALHSAFEQSLFRWDSMVSIIL